MTDQPPDFLIDHPEPRPWQLPDGTWESFEPLHLFLGEGDHPLEVAVAISRGRPNVGDVRQLWKRRKANRPAPVLLIVIYPDGGRWLAAACGPAGDDPPVIVGRDPEQIERVTAAALAEPNRNAAIRFLAEVLPETESELPGIHNAGMFFTHALRTDVPSRADWGMMTSWGRRIVGERGKDLIRALGFDVDQLGASTSVLRVKDSGTKVAVAVFLDEGEVLDGVHQRFGGSSPVAHALAAADAENLPFVVLTRGSQIRVYAATKHTGVGRKGRAETFVEANLALLPGDLAGYLPLLFGAPALQPDGSFGEILELSSRYATALGERLRDRVYDEAVPRLARIVAGHHHGATAEVSEADLADLYETAMVILFRMLFVAYAEDKDLLPYRSNALYQRHALKTLAQELADRANDGRLDFDPDATDMWEQLQSLWHALSRGHRDWDVPPYNGGMFSDDPAVSPVGARIAGLEVTNAEIGPALQALLTDRDPQGAYGPVDFRSLSVREFGTIYEGLLESSLSVAPTDLSVDSGGNYVPARDGDPVEVAAGEIYLHGRSGGRKSTGSYFTKPFAVEHLLDHALDPALDDHLDRIRALLEAGEEADAAEQLFDFRVADIAMGSGHFLVAAVDHIEARLATFLADHPIPRVTADLQELRKVALGNLGELADAYEIEDSSLLRRHIARRCIYGVDLNLIAVELARLAIWIHTFVPGLPLSFLDHNLIQGDSLTGIGTIDEALDVLAPHESVGTPSVSRGLIEEWLRRSEDDLRRLARLNDATTVQVEEARAAHRRALEAIEPVKKLFDLLVAVRLGEAASIEDFSDEALAALPNMEQVSTVAKELAALHFPVAFPEVFLRDRSGFDTIIGNPPWEETTVEELGFWALRFPGLRSMPQAQQRRELERLRADRPDLVEEYRREVERAERIRRVLTAGAYPGMGTGDPDLYKAFCWRFWHLTSPGGAIGVVLPRSALSASGSGPWRLAVLDSGQFSDVTLLLNNRRWVFPEVHPQYTIGLVSIRKGDGGSGELRLRGPFSSLERFRDGVVRSPAVVDVSEFRTWSDHASFPLLPSERSVGLFLKLRAHPRFDSDDHPWAARPVTELHATNEKQHMILDPDDTEGLWPVYKGASFNLWEPDTGTYYAWADPDRITAYLYEKRLRQARHAGSPFSKMPPDWIRDKDTLSCLHPRIVFRDITNRTNARTVIVCLISPIRVLANTAPHLLFERGDRRDQIYVLGVLSSIPLDWYARGVVETHVNFHILNSLPIPNPPRDDPLRRRVEEVTAQLVAGSDPRLASWVEELGFGPFPGRTDDADGLVAELDALVAALYGLDADDVSHIFETFREGWHPTERLSRVLTHLRSLR